MLSDGLEYKTWEIVYEVGGDSLEALSLKFIHCGTVTSAAFLLYFHQFCANKL